MRLTATGAGAMVQPFVAAPSIRVPPVRSKKCPIGGTILKYIIRATIDPVTGIELEANPANLERMVGKWQELNPIGMYFCLTRREITIVLEADNEDVFFEALHNTWVITRSYPDVTPVVSGEEFPSLLKRLGIAK